MKDNLDGSLAQMSTKKDAGWTAKSPTLCLFFVLFVLIVPTAHAQTVLPLTEREGLLCQCHVPASQSVSLEMKRLRSGIATVTISVNGKNRRFVIDPGCETTSMSPEVVGLTQERLRALKENSTVQTTGFTGRTKTVLARTSIVLGPMAFENKIVVVEDFSGISDSVGEHIDGLLGQDILTQFSRVTLDFKHRLLNLSK